MHPEDADATKARQRGQSEASWQPVCGVRMTGQVPDHRFA